MMNSGSRLIPGERVGQGLASLAPSPPDRPGKRVALQIPSNPVRRLAVALVVLLRHYENLQGDIFWFWTETGIEADSIPPGYSPSSQLVSRQYHSQFNERLIQLCKTVQYVEEKTHGLAHAIHSSVEQPLLSETQLRRLLASMYDHVLSRVVEGCGCLREDFPQQCRQFAKDLSIVALPDVAECVDIWEWVHSPFESLIPLPTLLGNVRFLPPGQAGIPWQSRADASGMQSTDDRSEFRPATWFRKGMADRLRQAASKKRKSKRVTTRMIDGVVCYSVADVRRWWPDGIPKEA